MKNILEKYNNLCDTVIHKIVLNYEKGIGYNLTICIEIECFNIELNSWQLVEFRFTKVTEFVIKENNTTNGVIFKASLVQVEKGYFIDFGFGDETSLENVRAESDFYICFEEMGENILINYSV